MDSNKKINSEGKELPNDGVTGTILYSSSYERGRELGEQMKAIGANVQIVSDMSETKQKIESENHGLLIADVSGFDPSGVNMLNWFNNHVKKQRVKSLGIITSASTLIPKCTYHIHHDNTFTIGDITFDELASVMMSLYNSGSTAKWLRTATEAYHHAKEALSTGIAVGKVVLLLGEAGVGRDAFAQIAHDMGAKKDYRFIYADCRLHSGRKFLPLTTQKAKNDVTRNIKAMMAEANSGTLYFHEADLLPKEIQNILAKVIRKNTFYEPGTDKVRKFTGLTVVSVRSSNYNRLTKELQSVVNPITIRIPSLSQCKDDILSLSDYFLHYFCMKESLPPMKLSDKAKDALNAHEWTGNIRELFAVITRAAQISNKKTITSADLNLKDAVDEKKTSRPVNHKAQVKKVLREADGKKARAARILGISRQTMYRWIKEYGISDDYPKGES